MAISDAAALIAGLARNCEGALPRTLRRLDQFRDTFSRVKYVIVTNDSDDRTESLLRSWSEQHGDVVVITLDGLCAKLPQRTARIAFARNSYILELQRDEARGVHYDFLLVADLDGVNENLVSDPTFTNVLERAPSDWGALFANQRAAYYDIWALRHPTWSPGDCWAEVSAAQGRLLRNFPFRKARAIERSVSARQVKIEPSEAPISVDSAFGGFGIYRTPYLKGAVYYGVGDDGAEVCEHVAFNSFVKKNGAELYIHPALLNDAPIEHLYTSRRAKLLRPWLSNYSVLP